MKNKVQIDPKMDMTRDMDLVEGSKGISYWFTTLADIPEDFFAKYVKGKRFIDLGCGDGRIVWLARRCGALKYRGIEIDESFIRKAAFHRYMKKGDFHDIDFNNYDVLYYFLFSDVDKELELVERLKNFDGVIIVYHRKVTHRLPEFHEAMVKQGFKSIEDIKYLRVYKK